MKFIEWIKSKLTGNESVEINSELIEQYYQKNAAEFNLTEAALFTSVDLIAKATAKAEFVTVENNEAVEKDEYYLWNYAPNKHQTKAEFIQQLIITLILKNEVMIFESTDGQLLIAEGFTKNEYAFFDDVFTNVTARNWTSQRSYKSSEVIYLKYSNFAVTRLLSGLCAKYEGLCKAAEQRYVKSVGHKGILNIKNTATGTQDFQKRYEELLNVRFKNYFNQQNAVLPLFEGFDYSEPSADAHKTTNSEIGDIVKLRTEIYAIVGNAFHIPPALIEGTASQLSDAVTEFISNAVEPITQMLAQAITVKRNGLQEFCKGNYMLIDTTRVRHIDIISSAVNIDKAIANGTLNTYQAQKYCNMLPCNEPWAKEYRLTKNYDTVKGGENNAT